MIQTFIRAGSRQLVVLTCAVAAVAATTASAAPMADLRSEVAAMGLDPDSMPAEVSTMRRAAAKRSGPILQDNGVWSGINGLASELNTIVTDARTADDFDVDNAIWGATHLDATLYVGVGQNQDGRLEIYASEDQCRAPVGPPNSRPKNPFLSNPPLFVFTTVDGIRLGSQFGYDLREYDWNTPGMNLTCGKYWECPIQVGRGSGRGFHAFADSPHSKGSIACFRSTFFGYPNWVSNYGGLDFDCAFVIFGNRTGAKNCCAAPSGGSCDLSPIEAKLDDETRFTDDAELADLQLIIESRASQASVDALEAKADAMQLALDQLQNTLCDIVRLLHTPNGLRQATCNGVDYEWNGLQGGGGD